MTQIAILILAAGASSRMGGLDKLMQTARDMPLLALLVHRAVATRLATFVTLPDLSHPFFAGREQLVLAGNAMPVPVPDSVAGMGTSIRAGVSALASQAGAVMILPGDMPDLQTGDLLGVAQTARAHPGSIVRATTPDGNAGHPVVFPARYFSELQQITGDQGARAILKAHAGQVRPHVLPGTRAIVDLDTPADWRDWRAAQRDAQISEK